LRAAGLSKAYGSLEVFAGVDLAIDRGSRVVVLGLNGPILRPWPGMTSPESGSSTPPSRRRSVVLPAPLSDSGEVIPGHGLKIGYYAQEHETIDTAASVVENLRRAAPGMDGRSGRC